MIYLIGGAPRCGKTILAKKLALKKKISFISTDALRSVILAYVNKNKLPYETVDTPPDKFHFEHCSPPQLLKFEIIEAKALWPGIVRLIKQLIECRQDYIIEGVHLLPELVNQLRKTRYWPKIKTVYLIKTDLTKIKSGLLKNKKEFDWIFAGGVNVPGRLDKASQMIRAESLYFQKQAKKYKFKLVNTEIDFNKKLKVIVK